jgi:hypothetical protein
VYYVYCDHKEIPEEQRAPISDILIPGFIDTLTGIYVGTTIRNYVDGIRAWYLIHSVPWERNKTRIDALPSETSPQRLQRDQSGNRTLSSLDYNEKILSKFNQNV